MQFALALLLLSLGTTSAAGTMATTADPDTRYVPGRFVAPGVDIENSGINDAEMLLGHSVLSVDGRADPESQAEQLSQALGVAVHPMVMYQLFSEPAEEPLFSEQWALENRGQTGGLSDADIDAASMWQWSQGRDVVIAIIDSGVDLAHPDLAPTLWRNPGEIPDNGLDDDANGFVDDRTGWDFTTASKDVSDEIGHGTSVQSVALAGSDGTGMAGVAPRARAMVVKACGGFGCQADHVAKGIVYAVDNGANVINLSLGAPGIEPLVATAVEYAAAQGVLVVVAAGNNAEVITSDNPWTPVSIDVPAVVAVASTTDADVISGSSNRGPDLIDVAAPGDGIITAALGGGHVTRSGTSFSAPHVAGVAAAMIALDRNIDVTELAALLTDTTDSIAGLDGLVGSGGRVNGATAAQAARFRDIPGTPFASDVMWAAVTGVTKGCTPSLFCPDDLVTRGQMAAFLARALDLPASDTDSFSDDDQSVFEADIDAIAAAGITKGCAPADFCPGDPITRGQMAAFLARALELPSADSDSFSDDDQSMFEAAIDAIAAAGITQGCTPDAYCPDDPVSRGQMAAFLNRSAKLGS